MLFILILLFTTNTFATEPDSCNSALEELSRLKLDLHQGADRAQTLILKEAYQNKVAELAERLNITVDAAEKMIASHDLVNSHNLQSRLKTVPAVVGYFKDPEFILYPNYLEILQRAEEIRDEYLAYYINFDSSSGAMSKRILEYYLEHFFKNPDPNYNRGFVLLISNAEFFFQKTFSTKSEHNRNYWTFIALDFPINSKFLIEALKNNDNLLIGILFNRFGSFMAQGKVFKHIVSQSHNLAPIVKTSTLQALVSGADKEVLLQFEEKESLLHYLVRMDNTSRQLRPNYPVKDEILIRLAEAVLSTPSVTSSGESISWVEQLSEIGRTPIFGAQAELLDLFIKYTANVNVQDIKGNTPLHALVDAAASTGRANILTLRTLLKAGADPSIRNKDGLTPYGLAKRCGVSVVEYFIEEFEKHNIRQ